MRSIAAACSSDAPSSITIPTFQFPAVKFDGKRLQKAKVVPEMSVSSRLPTLTWKIATPRHWPSGPVGGLSVGQGQISWHEQLATYVPVIRQAISPPSVAPRATEPPCATSTHRLSVGQKLLIR